jgi:hypothetical protein
MMTQSQCRPAHSARLCQLRQLDRGGLGGAPTDTRQQTAPAPQAPAEQRVECWLLQLPERPFQHLRFQAPRRGIGGSFGADHHRGGRDGAGQIAIEPIRRSPHRGVAEVRQENGSRHRVDQYRVTADRAVSDACPPQGHQLAVQVIERGVADLGGVDVRQRRPGRRHPVDQQRVMGRSRRSRLDDLGHGDIGQPRSHGHVGLMLDLLEPGDRQARPGVPVQQEPARLGEQPGVGRVPAVDRDTEAPGRIRPAYLGRLELCHPPDLPDHRVHIPRADTEPLEQQPDVLGRGQAERRAENEPDHRRHPPADDQAPQHVERQPVASDGRRQGHEGDEDLDEALHAARQIRQPRGGDRHEQGDLHDGKAHVVAVDRDPARTAAAASEDGDQDSARRRRPGRTQPDVACDLPAAGEQGQCHQDDHDAGRARLVYHRHQPCDAPWRRMDHPADGPVDPGVIPDDQQAAHQSENGGGQPHAVASAPASLAAADRGEYGRAPATQEMLLRKRASALGDVLGHTGPQPLRRREPWPSPAQTRRP